MALTDYSEADIATRRHVASVTVKLSLVLCAAGVVGVLSGYDAALWSSVIGFAGFVDAQRMRDRANRWETELEDGDSA